MTTKFGWCLTNQHDKCPEITAMSERRTPCGCDCHDAMPTLFVHKDSSGVTIREEWPDGK